VLVKAAIRANPVAEGNVDVKVGDQKREIRFRGKEVRDKDGTSSG